MKTTLNLLKTLIDQSFKGSQTRKWCNSRRDLTLNVVEEMA